MPLSGPHLNFVLSISGLDIGSIRTHDETATELSNSSGEDDVAPRCSHTGVCLCSSVLRVHPSLSAPDMSVSFSCAGFDIGSIRIRYETSTELSSSSGDDTLRLYHPFLDPGPDTR